MSRKLNSNRHSVYSLKYHLKDYYWESVFWSKSYCIISTIETIEEYIQSQDVKEQNRLNSSPPQSN